MGFITAVGCISFSILVVQILLKFRKKKVLIPISGTVDPRFEKVKNAFQTNYDTNWEKEGSAFAVYHKGKLVVDLWGGFADRGGAKRWKEDTMTVVYSSTKAVCALCAAILVERGQLNYDALVTEYWPEFGKHGKDKVTVAMLLSHQAGLAAIDEKITAEDTIDWRAMGRHFENQVPNWPPGTSWGYHALTFGYVVDQLLRRVDPTHRSLGTFIQEEIIKESGHDFYLGLPKEKFHRVARLTAVGLSDLSLKKIPGFVLFIFKIFAGGKDSLFLRAGGNPSYMKFNYGGMNNPDILAYECGAAGGVGTARGLAGVFNLLIQGKLIPRDSPLLDRLNSGPLTLGQKEATIGIPEQMGYGFSYFRTPQGQYAIGHPGYGGQNVKADLHNDLTFAYVTNGLTPDMGDTAHNFENLMKAVYASI